jgi:hypothetical protein
LGSVNVGDLTCAGKTIITNGGAVNIDANSVTSALGYTPPSPSEVEYYISELSNKISNFLDVDDVTVDQLSELIALINNNKTSIESITNGKINVTDIVDNLTTTTAGKVLSANQGVEIKKLITELQSALVAVAITKGTDTTASKTLGFGDTFTAVTDTSVNGLKLTDTTTTYTMPSDRLFVTLVPTGTSIPANANLNTTAYLKVGRYYCSKNVDAETLDNSPLSAAFMMEVSSPLSTTIDNETTKTWVYRLRKITAYNTGVQYI